MKHKKSIVSSILLQKCPQRREGNMFSHSTYSSKFMKMKSKCSYCGLDFNQEPSFYFGAMYFSFAIQIMVFGIVYLVLRFTIDPRAWIYAIWVSTACFLIIPLNFRLSRVMWIYLFIPNRDNSNHEFT